MTQIHRYECDMCGTEYPHRGGNEFIRWIEKPIEETRGNPLVPKLIKRSAVCVKHYLTHRNGSFVYRDDSGYPSQNDVKHADENLHCCPDCAKKEMIWGLKILLEKLEKQLEKGKG